MNKKQKIIVSVVGITIILLTLLGLTYGYYLTRIQGNTNDKSIIVTTANLELIYDDGNGLLTAENILPGQEIVNKTFSITSNSNVAISYGVFLEEVINTFNNNEDIVYTLNCTSNLSNCDGINGKYPIYNTKLIENSIQPNETQYYTLKIEYRETGKDQSIDMGKLLSGKINIYSLQDIVNLNGKVSNYENGDYVVVNSETPKRSEIINGEFKVVGLKSEEHTINLFNKENVSKGSTTFTIKNGKTATINDKTFIVTKDSSNLFITLNSKSLSNITLDSIDNPFYQNNNSLNYHILNNSKNNVNGTSLVENTLSKPGVVAPGTKYNEKKWSQTNNSTFFSDNANKIVMYATTYEFDQNTGLFKLKNVKTSKLSSLKITNTKIYFGLPILQSENTTSTSNLTTVYFLNKTYNGALYAEQEPVDEKELSYTSDDYGTSYYYRGNVIDNYVNFASMCWRIVRIEGDGSIKLILEDNNAECNSNLYTGNFIISNGLYGTMETNGTINYINQSDSNYMINSFKTFQSTLNSAIMNKYGNAESISTKLKKENWCIDISSYSDRAGNENINQNQIIENINNNADIFFGSFKRLYGQKIYTNTSLSPTLNCDNYNNMIVSKYMDNNDIYVGTITADEAVYAGAEINVKKSNIYLYNDYFKKQTSKYWMTLSPALYRNSNLATFSFYYNGSFSGISPTSSSNGLLGIRPAIVLANSIEITSGDGTKTNPYIIK